MLVIPKGVWGSFSSRFGVVLFPVGYRLRPADGGAAPPAPSDTPPLDGAEAGATPAIAHEAADPPARPGPGSVPRPGRPDPRGGAT